MFQVHRAVRSLAFLALGSSLIAGLSFACDDEETGETGGDSGAGRGGNAGTGNTSGVSGAASSGGEGGVPEELAVTLRFAAKVGTETFSCGSSYAGLGADDSTVNPVDFRFYVHDVRLLAASGEQVPVALTQDGLWQYEGVALLDFENRTGSCANGTVELNDVVLGTVPSGVYAGVAFKLGVPFELNHTDIATAPSPLNLSSMFWSWNTGRLFLSIMNSVERAGEARFGTLLHLGSTGCMGDVASGGVTSCSRPNRGEYVLPAFRPDRDVVVVDMLELLRNSNLKTDQCHSFEEECAPMLEELGIDWSTGAASAEQSVFRVE